MSILDPKDNAEALAEALKEVVHTTIQEVVASLIPAMVSAANKWKLTVTLEKIEDESHTG